MKEKSNMILTLRLRTRVQQTDLKQNNKFNYHQSLHSIIVMNCFFPSMELVFHGPRIQYMYKMNKCYAVIVG